MSRNLIYDQTILKLKSKFTDKVSLDILDNMQKVYEAKDNDYSSTGLPMGNLRKCEDAGIEAWRGCIVRMGDKISRLENFLQKNEYQVAEKADDTIIDLANYSILMSCLLNEIIQSDQLNRHYQDLTLNARKDLFNLTFYCVTQASMWKQNKEHDLSNLHKVIGYWNNLCEFSIEMI